MGHRDAFFLMTAIIALGALGLLGTALSAALEGVWTAAVFIGALGTVLLGTVVLGLLRARAWRKATKTPGPSEG